MHMKRIVNYIILNIGIFIYHRALMAENGLAERLEQILLKFGSTIALSKMRQLSVKPSTNKYAIHTLICKNDVNRYIISIYSLLRFLKKFPLLFIHEDGSITERQMKLLQTLPNVTVISHALATKVCKNFYSDFTSIDFFRRIDPKVKKITDIICFINTQKVLILDSDVIFYSKPTELITFLQTKGNRRNILYLEDLQHAYGITREAIKKIYHVNEIRKINTGILCFESNILNKRFIEQFFTRLLKNKQLHIIPYWLDQTPWAILASKCSSSPLPKSYSIGYGKTPPHVICRHYIHGSREQYLYDLQKIFCS